MTNEHSSTIGLGQPTQAPTRISLMLEDWITVFSIGALACITMANVIVRYLTSESFAWTEEISIFFLIVLTMSASSSAFVRRLHIRIEILAETGSSTRQRKFLIINSTLCLIFFVILTILLGRMALDEYNWGDTSPAIGIPTWWYSIWLPILAGLISLRLLGILIRSLRS